MPRDSYPGASVRRNIKATQCLEVDTAHRGPRRHATFGSVNVRKLYQAWRSTIAAIDTEKDALCWNAEENPDGPILYDHDLKHLRDVLSPRELAARQVLADAIAEELGHR
jgi:hypothetical protein